MVCPYCSAEMEAIELNGKVFCSNCGLTISNNAPESTPNVVNPEPTTVSDVATEAPEEVEFPVIPEIAENIEAVPTETETIPRKLEVTTEEPATEPVTSTDAWSPITEAAEKEMGLEEKEPETSVQPVEPVFESKISDLSIPSEEDFNSTTETSVSDTGSYIELANPGSERATLEASGILLDILGEEEKVSTPLSSSNEVKDPEILRDTQNDSALNPVLEPEIPAETETKEVDDIYTLPSEVKVGLTSKKVKKETPIIDPKTEKKIEKLEEKIEKIEEPEISITPEEAEQYDPDTIDVADINPNIEKGKVIKEYFSTAIEKDKTAHKAKAKKAKRKKSHTTLVWVALSVVLVAGLAVSSYFAYAYFQPETQTAESQAEDSFAPKMPENIPEGYTLADSKFTNSNKTFEILYQFANDETRTILYKQIKPADADAFTSNYLLEKGTTYAIKEVDGVDYAETGESNLLWESSGFVFIIESNNFNLSNDLLYKMAESVK